MNAKIEQYFMSPVYHGILEFPSFTVSVSNPVCGDQAHIDVILENERISDARFRAYGCSTSIATASIITEQLIVQPIANIVNLTAQDVANLLGELSPRERHCIEIGKKIVDQVVEQIALINSNLVPVAVKNI